MAESQELTAREAFDLWRLYFPYCVTVCNALQHIQYRILYRTFGSIVLTEGLGHEQTKAWMRGASHLHSASLIANWLVVEMGCRLF